MNAEIFINSDNWKSDSVKSGSEVSHIQPWQYSAVGV